MIGKKSRQIRSPLKQKALLLLLGGVALGFAYSPRAQKRIFKSLFRQWRWVDRQYLYRLVKEFHRDRLVDYVEQKNGLTKIVLSEAGRQRAIEFRINAMKINKPLRWDKRWRVVFFDVPEKRRKIRDVFRSKLRDMGFFEYQKSVFVYPYPCYDEIDFIIEYYSARPYVRRGELLNLTNDAELKLHFKLK